MAEIEAIVEPDRIADDVGWESVAFVGIPHLILPIWRYLERESTAFLCVHPSILAILGN